MRIWNKYEELERVPANESSYVNENFDIGQFLLVW